MWLVEAIVQKPPTNVIFRLINYEWTNKGVSWMFVFTCTDKQGKGGKCMLNGCAVLMSSSSSDWNKSFRFACFSGSGCHHLFIHYICMNTHWEIFWLAIFRFKYHQIMITTATSHLFNGQPFNHIQASNQP